MFASEQRYMELRLRTSTSLPQVQRLQPRRKASRWTGPTLVKAGSSTARKEEEEEETLTNIAQRVKAVRRRTRKRHRPTIKSTLIMVTVPLRLSAEMQLNRIALHASSCWHSWRGTCAIIHFVGAEPSSDFCTTARSKRTWSLAVTCRAQLKVTAGSEQCGKSHSRSFHHSRGQALHCEKRMQYVAKDIEHEMDHLFDSKTSG